MLCFFRAIVFCSCKIFRVEKRVNDKSSANAVFCFVGRIMIMKNVAGIPHLFRPAGASMLVLISHALSAGE